MRRCQVSSLRFATPWQAGVRFQETLGFVASLACQAVALGRRLVVSFVGKPSPFQRSLGAVGCILFLLFCILHPLSSVASAKEGASAETPRTVGWTDLTVKVEFEDPFEALTADQLMELSIYARVMALKKQDAAKVSEAMQREADEVAQSLTKQGVDIAGLLARREEIKELRKKRATAMDESLDGVAIKMPGYALALEYDGKNVTEFLLVPWVGACIHTPPPPPNQIVYVKAAQPFEFRSRFEPVWIEGTMAVGGTQKELFLVDGSSNIEIGYSMASAVISRYETGPKAEVRSANHKPPKNGT